MKRKPLTAAHKQKISEALRLRKAKKLALQGKGLRGIVRAVHIGQANNLHNRIMREWVANDAEYERLIKEEKRPGEKRKLKKFRQQNKSLMQKTAQREYNDFLARKKITT